MPPSAPLTGRKRLNPTWSERLAIWKLAGYFPSPEQLQAHLSPASYKLVAGGERGGKSFSAAMELIARHHLGTLFWLIGPDYRLCREEFRYIVNFFTKIGAVEKLNFPQNEFQPCYLRLKGGIEFQTLTGGDAKKLASRAPDGILGCEAAQLDEETFLKMYGRLAETDGWLWLSGTFEHDSYLSWYAEKYEQWFGGNTEYDGESFSLPTWANRAIFPGGLEDPKIIALKRDSPNDEWFLERYGGIPCPPPTAVFREFRIRTHVTSDADFQRYKLNDKGEPLRDDETKRPIPRKVELAIDPGYNGAYAVAAIQHIPPFVNVVDEVYLQQMTAPEVIAACQEREWWPNVADVGVIDIAGTQHQGLASHVEIWQSLAGVALESAKVDIPPGIARMRTFLKEREGIGPLLRYSPKCKNSIREFTLYQYKAPQEGKATSEKPIDAFNHSAKAVAYWLVARFGHVDAKAQKSKRRMKYGARAKQKFQAARGGRPPRRSAKSRRGAL